MFEIIYPVAVIALGFFVLGVTGFGSALVIVPLLSWQWPLAQVVPLVLLLDFAGCLLLGGMQWERIEARLLLRLLPWLLGGAGLGWLVMQQPAWANSPLLLLVLGCYVIWVGVRGLRQTTTSQHSLFKNPIFSGLLAGLIEVIFGTSGPVMVGHLVTRLRDAHTLRVNISAALLLLSGLASIVMGLTGRLSSPELGAWLPGLALTALISLLLGHRLAHRLPAAKLRQAILGLLILSGLSLLAQVAHASLGRSS